MVHLDELQETYGRKGLVVLAVTNEARSVVDAFVQKTSAKHPIVIESSDSKELYGSGGFPSSFLIGPDGRVAWSGHPGGVNAALLEPLLEKARVGPELPKKYAAITTAMEKSRFADAHQRLVKALAGDPGEEERGTLEQAKEWVEWFGQSGLDSAERDCAEGRWYEASLALDEVAKGFKGHPFAAAADAKLKELKADPKAREEIAAGERLAKAIDQNRDKKPKQAIPVFKALAKKYEGTRAGARAAEILADLEKRE